jgi:hypothetical protein
MKENNLIALSLIYYDTQKEKYKKYYKKDYKLILEINDNHLDLPKFFLQKNNINLIEGNFNIIGIFYKNKNEFRWGWDLIILNHFKQLIKNNTYFIRQIINYIFDYNINEENIDEELLFYKDLKNYFLNPIIYIKNPIQLEKILAITQYITKSEMIYKISDIKNNRDNFYILKNITNN